MSLRTSALTTPEFTVFSAEQGIWQNLTLTCVEGRGIDKALECSPDSEIVHLLNPAALSLIFLYHNQFVCENYYIKRTHQP